jgi:hypothetical protein
MRNRTAIRADLCAAARQFVRRRTRTLVLMCRLARRSVGLQLCSCNFAAVQLSPDASKAKKACPGDHHAGAFTCGSAHFLSPSRLCERKFTFQRAHSRTCFATTKPYRLLAMRLA